MHTNPFKNYPPNIYEAMSKPTMDTPNPALTKFHELLHKELVHQAKVPCCLTCIHFSDPRYPRANVAPGICTKYNSAPPPHVIVFGCEAWETDDIPF